MCEKCALREKWGYNYKQQKGYKRWVQQQDPSALPEIEKLIKKRKRKKKKC